MKGRTRGSVGLVGRLAKTSENHGEAAGPVFSGDHADPDRAEPDELVVVTFNLHFGRAVDVAIESFANVQPLPEAGIILLQEMSESGVERFARAAGYNYLYYPASVGRGGDNFGNAVLARWPISNPIKLILPGLHPVTGQQRTATGASVSIGGKSVHIYSTHIEVSTAPPSFRARQALAILDHIPEDAERVIVGGDFNAVTWFGVRALRGLFSRRALEPATLGLGATYRRFGVRPSATDHIFARGFERTAAGVLREVKGSDHYPVWVRFRSGD